MTILINNVIAAEPEIHFLCLSLNEPLLLVTATTAGIVVTAGVGVG